MLKIAIVGNPNGGKTTLFNALTGANQYVGNWPGVTVEKKSGVARGYDDVELTDLPGVYSLSPYSPEEIVARDFLVEEEPDAIINIVDATNIERNLYLTMQILETGVPTIVALNMWDLVEKQRVRIDIDALSAELGVPIVKTSALKEIGARELMEKAVKIAREHKHLPEMRIFSDEIERQIDAVAALLPAQIPGLHDSAVHKRFFAIKFLEGDFHAVRRNILGREITEKINKIHKALEARFDDSIEGIIIGGRYDWVQRICAKCVDKSHKRETFASKIDEIVTSRILGLPIFFGVMFLVYYVSVSTVGSMTTDFVNETLIGGLQSAVRLALKNAGAADVILGLVCDGILGGLGAILSFLPQMAILFFFLSFLEDCGYMVRIAFVMDRVFRFFGLSGKSFIPLLVSSGCGVTGIMASQTIENEADRRLTIMTTTFVPCGAKLPVIALMGGVLGGYAANSATVGAILAPLMYLIGVICVLLSALILKKMKPFQSKITPFVMELPSYHLPRAKNLFQHIWERLKDFIVKAGTVLFLATVAMWFLSQFGFEGGKFGFVSESDNSILAFLGGILAPVFAPLGFGKWQAVSASIAGFSAKEAIVTTMGVLSNAAGAAAENEAGVAAAVRAWFPTGISAFSFLLFNLIDSPCLAAVATISSQMRSRKWFWATIAFQNIFAYSVCLCVFQLGSFFSSGIFTVGTAAGFAVVAILAWLVMRKNGNSIGS